MLVQCGRQVLAALNTVRLIDLLILEQVVEPPQQSLIVDAHGLEEAHFKLLAITAELGRQSISLTL